MGASPWRDRRKVGGREKRKSPEKLRSAQLFKYLFRRCEHLIRKIKMSHHPHRLFSKRSNQDAFFAQLALKVAASHFFRIKVKDNDVGIDRQYFFHVRQLRKGIS